MASFGVKVVAESSYFTAAQETFASEAELERMGAFFVFFQEFGAVTSQPKHPDSRHCLLSAQKVEY